MNSITRRYQKTTSQLAQTPPGSPFIPLDPQHCYQALCSHDRRFDGQFFVAVRSTGIYCRPVCPARTPKQENCQFYRHAAIAEQAGFRPCLRCRPELAPGLSTLELSDQILYQACHLIRLGYMQQHNLKQLAIRLGISGRHLRRLFQQHYGVTPSEYVRSQRLLQAKQLLTDTRLPLADIAVISGFGSTRRLHSLFQQQYQLTPGQLRRQSAPSSRKGDHSVDEEAALQLSLSYRPPLDWPALLQFLAQRSIAGVEQVDQVQQCYRRTVHWQSAEQQSAEQHYRGWIELHNDNQRYCLRLKLSHSLLPVLPAIQQRARQLFDLDCDPALINTQLQGLAPFNPGLRVPGCMDGFEMAVRAILGQQITVKAAHTLAGRLASAFGTVLETPWPALSCCFPQPSQLATLEASQLAELGIIRQRGRAIIALAQALQQGNLSLNPMAPVDQTLNALQALPGIGPWTAQYIAMRALSWPDAFPDSDLGIIKALEPRLRSRKRRDILAFAARWQPWRASAVMQLWHGAVPVSVNSPALSLNDPALNDPALNDAALITPSPE
ncbi:MAG: helix-turn-helix domain-containing protein [Marinobacterium sp.]|nr:helix-turn-helix domain-containing protein [Marinobacterium sp.]